MSLVRLLGFTTLGCGCVVGRYREVATSREVAYVEEKGKSCGSHGHRRNHTITAERSASIGSIPLASKASRPLRVVPTRPRPVALRRHGPKPSPHRPPD